MSVANVNKPAHEGQRGGSVLQSKDEFAHAKHTNDQPSHRVQEMGERGQQHRQNDPQKKKEHETND